MTRTSERTPQKGDWRTAFLAELAATGNVYRSAKKAKKPRSEVYKAKAEDAGFAAAWAEALEVAVEVMEDEVRRRAFDGTLKPVYQGGKKVGLVREYSDTLAIFLLKAHAPKKYRENSTVEHTGGVVQTHIYLPAKDDAAPAAGG